ncbi:30S ribosomal protein S4 [Candidatus Woesearchaeota archaeon]|nr:30S ribosomal protein S4 [Candidatus Woesearchaeota archaeon]
MGDPKKQKKKYRRPLAVWNEERIARDKVLIQNFGLKNKREIWKVESKLKSLHDQAKKLTAQNTMQAKKEAEQLLKRLSSVNLIQQNGKLDDVLSLTINDLLNRRLQTIVLKKRLARTVNQARQFITHNHISINGQVMNVPSYLVPLNEEQSINFNTDSTLANIEHPERVKEEPVATAEVKKEKKARKSSKKKEEEKLEEELPEEKKKHKEK